MAKIGNTDPAWTPALAVKQRPRDSEPAVHLKVFNFDTIKLLVATLMVNMKHHSSDNT